MSHPGIARRVTAKAKINPRTVPAAPTAQPSKMLLTAACRSYQLEIKGFKLASVKPPSAQKVIARRRAKG